MIHSAGVDVWVHSCGNIQRILPDLTEMGVDTLNPVQPECMDIYEIKEKFGHKITFWGGISTQRDLPVKTPDEIRQVTRELLAAFPHGGLIAAPTHDIPADALPENVAAMLETLEEQKNR